MREVHDVEIKLECRRGRVTFETSRLGWEFQSALMAGKTLYAQPLSQNPHGMRSNAGLSYSIVNQVYDDAYPDSICSLPLMFPLLCLVLAFKSPCSLSSPVSWHCRFPTTVFEATSTAIVPNLFCQIFQDLI